YIYDRQYFTPSSKIIARCWIPGSLCLDTGSGMRTFYKHPKKCYHILKGCYQLSINQVIKWLNYKIVNDVEKSLLSLEIRMYVLNVVVKKRKTFNKYIVF